MFESQIQIRSPHYGKIKPLCGSYYESPQLYMVFLSCILAAIVIYLLLFFVFITFWHRIIGSILCVYFSYRFLSLCFSDPGMAFQRDTISQAQAYRFCQTCMIPVQRSTRHCTICDVCIDEYDHHCIFVGKCIGKNNYWQFKQFLCLIFSTLIYGIIVAIGMTKIED